MTSTRIKRILLTPLLLVGLSVIEAKEADQQVPEDNVSAIINGSSGSVSTYPWMVFLADAFEEQYCGASLISETWVLTAAHCFVNGDDQIDLEEGAESIIVLNSDTASPLASDAEIGQVGQIVIHPSYNPDPATSDNLDDFDIALVELTAAVSFQPVQLLSGSAPALAGGTETLIMGWGTTAVGEDNQGIDPSDDLLVANQQIVSVADCENIYGDGITENMICAGAVEEGGTTDTCQGDSGGPMLVSSGSNYVQVGIVSFGGTETGPACGDPEAPGVYASVSALADFIAEHVSDAQFVTLDDTSGGDDSGDVPVLSISVDGSLVNIQWTAVAGATGYTLYYAPYPDQEPISALDMGPQLSISGELPSGSAFYVAIEAYDGNGSLPGLSNVEVLMVQ
ncbi:MAG: serine protease [Pseudomonadales bacterium]|nr:serine protease [Pseudomonadales bacterium]